ncbi:uncharacterized protein LOC119450315 isoform X1 [Dermacentor silvarum]|uniref:uncharacterized protein LOC119450315 isoform X1 n=2 Tax=Dermacentor silvarum TaxID=543639 RepID=UPI002101791C|nr:uncharacterized protein LOC119450315 isoform X1 [Dermacentor silvarum]XP_049521745.1 uncharacterized protein LOC119450315 isoform X1 [Dermacentor silvarum]XP_049521746.1 uncharacterized protein LOC119450315 isoform X1 [Dermacentor silvarum]
MQQCQETFTLSSPEWSRKYGEMDSIERSPDDSPHPRQSKAARQSSFLFVENVRRMDTKAGSPTNYSIQRYFNSIINVTPTQTDVQGLIGIPQHSPIAISEASQVSVQTPRAIADDVPEQSLLTVDPLVAKEPDDSAVVKSPQRRVSQRLAIAFPYNGWTKDSPAGMDKDEQPSEQPNEQPSASSAKRKPKQHPNSTGNSSNRTKHSSDQDRGTGTCSAPGNQSQSPTKVQENESLGDRTPCYNLRRNRPGIVKPQPATVNNFKTKAPNVCELGNKNALNAADVKQEGSKMANSSKFKHKRTRPPSPSSSSSCGSQKGGGPELLPLISRDLWSSRDFQRPRKPFSSFANRAFPEPASARSETNEQRFMREVFPELVKKNSVWARLGTTVTQDNFRSFPSPQTPRKSPLAVPAESRPDGPSGHHEGAAVQKKSLWSTPKVLRSQGSESNEGVGLTEKSKIKAVSALKCGTSLQLERAEVAKDFEELQGKAVLPVTGDAAPVRCETPENLGAENEAFELPRKKLRASKASLAIDSRLETVKPWKNFWHISGRSLNKTTGHDKSPVAGSKVAKEKALPEPPATSAELLDSTGEENISWIESLWRQRKSALRSRKFPSTYPSHKVSKPPALGKKSNPPTEPPKGGLDHKAKDATVQTYDVQKEVKDAIAQTSFMCMIGKSINLNRTEKKHLRKAFHAKEEEVQFMDLSRKQALGNGAIVFGHYFSTDTATFGVMRLDPSSEKALSANNDHDMFLYAVDTGVNITTLGGTWMLLPKGSTFYISRGLPFRLKNLSETMVKILYVLTEPSTADPVT